MSFYQMKIIEGQGNANEWLKEKADSIDVVSINSSIEQRVVMGSYLNTQTTGGNPVCLTKGDLYDTTIVTITYRYKNT